MSKICRHNRQRNHCKKCSPQNYCKHSRWHAECRSCKGSYICKHNRVRTKCKACGGLSVTAKMMYYCSKYRAKKIGRKFTITVQDILTLLGDGKCPVFRVRYDLNPNGKSNDLSPSLDRLNSKRGYTKENSVVICQLANQIKTNATSKQIRQVADWMEEENERRTKLQTMAR